MFEILQNFPNNLRNGSTHQLCTIYSDSVWTLISPAFPLLFFSFLLLVLMNNEWLFLLVADSLSKSVGIAPVFKNTLTFPTTDRNEQSPLPHKLKDKAKELLPSTQCLEPVLT